MCFARDGGGQSKGLLIAREPSSFRISKAIGNWLSRHRMCPARDQAETGQGLAGQARDDALAMDMAWCGSESGCWL